MSGYLRREIEDAINRCSAENGSNTPDHILAEFLVGCLAAFDVATRAREKWYGVHHTPGGAPSEPEPAAGEAGKLLALDDETLATLYSQWSEDTYCAGWIGDGHADFVEYATGGRGRFEREPLTDYQTETLREIRRLLAERAAKEKA